MGTDRTLGDRCCDLLIAPYRLHEIVHVVDGHVTGDAPFGPGDAHPLTHQLAASVKQLVALAVDKHGSLGAVDDRAPVITVAIGLVGIAALAIPLQKLALRESEGRHHRVVHFPAVVLEMVLAPKRLNRAREFYPQCPAGDIQFVGAVVGRLGRSPVPPPVPVVILKDIQEWPPWCRTLPKLPVEIRWRFNLPGYRHLSPAIDVKGRGVVNITNLATMNRLHHFNRFHRGSLLHANLEDDIAVLLFKFNQEPVLRKVVAGGLFQVNMLAGFGRDHGTVGMPMVRDRQGHRIHILFLDHLMDVGGGLRLVTELLLCLRKALFHLLAIHFTDPGDFHVRHVGKVAQVCQAAAFQPNHGNPYPAAGSAYRGVAFGTRQARNRGGPKGGSPDECASARIGRS